MQIKGIKVEWTQTFEHHCIYQLSCLKCVSHASAPLLTLTCLKAEISCLIKKFMSLPAHMIYTI